MDESTGILLNDHFVNQMTMNGELGWVIEDYNASSGFSWRYKPDNSGLTELVEEILLHPSTQAVGVPGKRCWKFKAVRAGKGSLLFELFPPGQEEPSSRTIFNIEVS